MDIHETLKKLPSSWDDIKMSQYQRILELDIIDNPSIHFEEDNTLGNIFDGVENSISILSVLIDVPASILEAMPYNDLISLTNKIDFTLQHPKPTKKSSVKWKDFETISFNSFINFTKLSQDPLKNLPSLVAEFSNLSEDEVLAMSVQDCLNGFFLFGKKLKRYLKSSARSLKRKILLEKLKNKLPLQLKEKPKQKSFMKDTDTSS